MNVILKFKCNGLCNSEYKSKKTCPIWVDNFDYHIFACQKAVLKKFDQCVMGGMWISNETKCKNMHNWVLTFDPLYNV